MTARVPLSNSRWARLDKSSEGLYGANPVSRRRMDERRRAPGWCVHLLSIVVDCSEAHAMQIPEADATIMSEQSRAQDKRRPTRSTRTEDYCTASATYLARYQRLSRAHTGLPETRVESVGCTPRASGAMV